MFSSGTSGMFEVRQRLINRNSRDLFSFTVNIVCNQQLWFSFDVSTERLDFFFHLYFSMVILMWTAGSI